MLGFITGFTVTIVMLLILGYIIKKISFKFDEIARRGAQSEISRFYGEHYLALHSPKALCIKSYKLEVEDYEIQMYNFKESLLLTSERIWNMEKFEVFGISELGKIHCNIKVLNFDLVTVKQKGVFYKNYFFGNGVVYKLMRDGSLIIVADKTGIHSWVPERTFHDIYEILFVLKRMEEKLLTSLARDTDEYLVKKEEDAKFNKVNPFLSKVLAVINKHSKAEEECTPEEIKGKVDEVNKIFEPIEKDEPSSNTEDTTSNQDESKEKVTMVDILKHYN